MNEDFVFRVLEIVGEIPEGKVSTYKQIATLAGKERNARQVAKILGRADMYGDYPNHRVITSSGRPAEEFAEQRSLLENEGVVFKDNGAVDLEKYLWKG
ncbi:MGMT family protein [Candidatus Saccharibacteria bacterium]|nr:MGMT family protein [Candidatus Saccharibacteria bacterium]